MNAQGWRALQWVLAAAGCLAIVACNRDAGAPAGFGLNVTADAQQLPAQVRAMVASGRITASGLTAVPTVQPVDLRAAIRSGNARFRFLPKVTSGTVTLHLDLLDVAGRLLGSGTSEAVVVRPDRASEVLIALREATTSGSELPDAGAGKAPGAACVEAADCSSGNCVDGVCCSTPCTGVCESCALAGKIGSCEPVADGMDPAQECSAVDSDEAPTPARVDGGADEDGGAGSGGSDGGVQLNPPDGGIARVPGACAGACNGARACRFPASEKACGAQWCNSDRQVAAMVCNGRGNCQPSLRACVDYTCEGGSCLTQCAALDQCQRDVGYCSADNSCKPLKGDGVGCNNGGECKTGHCAGGVCCNSACEAPFTCTETIGQCKCPGVVCPSGVACQLFYRDGDGDGFGDKFGKFGDGSAVAGCAGAPPPAGYVDDAHDCDDADGDAHPGQMGFFGVPSKGKGTYDYDCDGKLVEELPDGLGASCRFHTGHASCDEGTLTCSKTGETAGVGCHLACLRVVAAMVALIPGPFVPVPTRCFPVANDGFAGETGCGTLGEFWACGSCGSPNGTATGAYSYKRKQQCR